MSIALLGNEFFPSALWSRREKTYHELFRISWTRRQEVVNNHYNMLISIELIAVPCVFMRNGVNWLCRLGCDALEISFPTCNGDFDPLYLRWCRSTEECVIIRENLENVCTSWVDVTEVVSRGKHLNGIQIYSVLSRSK